MSESISDLVERLSDAVDRDDFLALSHDLMDVLLERDDASLAVPSLIKLIEDHPEVDFGTPGPLVHFVERFDGLDYESLLVESLRRQPTEHTLWMLNRIINGRKGKDKLRLINELHAIVDREELSGGVRNAAQGFLSMHE